MRSRCVQLLLTSLAIGLILVSPARSAEDPFPGVAHGAEIPGSRITSDPGVSQSEWEATSTYQSFSCPEGSGRGIGIDIASRKWFAYCVKQWQPQETVNAWAEYRKSLEDSQALAFAESKAWNAANPGKQKCVQWGPIRNPDGGESSGGVCANPVEPGPGTTVPTEAAPAVSAPAETPESSGPATSEPAPTPVSNSNLFVEDTEYRGSGYPFTRIYRGQLSTTDCPSGFQGANGIIVAIGTGTFTECWPVNAWAANRLGGEVWETFKASGGTFDVMAEVRRRENIENLKKESKRVAQVAADLTPGVQRCSRWTGYGESGTECAYAFVSPSGTTGSNSDSSTATGESSTVISVPNEGSSTADSTTTVSNPSSSEETVTVTMIPIEIIEVETSVQSVSSTNSEPLTEGDVQFNLIWFISRPELELRPV